MTLTAAFSFLIATTGIYSPFASLPVNTLSTYAVGIVACTLCACHLGPSPLQPLVGHGKGCFQFLREQCYSQFLDPPAELIHFRRVLTRFFLARLGIAPALPPLVDHCRVLCVALRIVCVFLQ